MVALSDELGHSAMVRDRRETFDWRQLHEIRGLDLGDLAHSSGFFFCLSSLDATLHCIK